MRNREACQDAACKRQLPNVDIDSYVFAAREKFLLGETMAQRWFGLQRLKKAISDYVYTVKNLRSGVLKDVYVSWLNFYHGEELDSKASMSHVLTSETGMAVVCLI